MNAILGLIMAAIFVYIGVNLLPGLNTTVATITTPTYDSGVAGLAGVVMIVFAAMKRRKIVASESNLSRITGRIAGNLNPFGHGNPQPSRGNNILVPWKVQRLGVELVDAIRPHKHPASLIGDGDIVRPSLKEEKTKWIIFGIVNAMRGAT